MSKLLKNLKFSKKAKFWAASLVIILLLLSLGLAGFLNQKKLFSSYENFLLEKATQILSDKYLFVRTLNKDTGENKKINIFLCKNTTQNPLDYDVITAFNTDNYYTTLIYHKIINLSETKQLGYQLGYYDSRVLLAKINDMKDCNEIKTGTFQNLNPSSYSSYYATGSASGNFLIESTKAISESKNPFSPYKKMGDWVEISPKESSFNGLKIEGLKRQTFGLKTGYGQEYLPLSQATEVTIDNLDGLAIFPCIIDKDNNLLEYFVVLGVPYFGYYLQWYSAKYSPNFQLAFDGSTYFSMLNGMGYIPDLNEGFIDVYRPEITKTKFIISYSCEELKQINFKSSKDLKDEWKKNKIFQGTEKFKREEEEIRKKDPLTQLNYITEQYNFFKKVYDDFPHNWSVEFRGTLYENIEEDKEKIKTDFAEFERIYRDFVDKYNKGENPTIPELTPFEMEKKRKSKEEKETTKLFSYFTKEFTEALNVAQQDKQKSITLFKNIIEEHKKVLETLNSNQEYTYSDGSKIEPTQANKDYAQRIITELDVYTK